MSDFSMMLDMPTEHMQKIFGARDVYVKKLEKVFQVTIVGPERRDKDNRGRKVGKKSRFRDKGAGQLCQQRK